MVTNRCSKSIQISNINQTIVLFIFQHNSFVGSDSGLEFQAVTSNAISIVSLDVNADSFQGGYHCEKKFSMTLDMNLLAKVLDGEEKSDVLTIKVEDEGSGKVTFTFANDLGDVKSEYHMKFDKSGEYYMLVSKYTKYLFSYFYKGIF